MTKKRTLVLFNYDWDEVGFASAALSQGELPPAQAGFDLFSFPSNARLAWFDIEKFVNKLASRAAKEGWTSVVSHHEQFGTLAAAMLAEKMGWPGTPVNAVLACQHKLYAREILQNVCPEANLKAMMLDTQYGGDIPNGLTYPLFVKPVKAAFSVLARVVHSKNELVAHTRFDLWELWVIRHLVEPFERVFQKRLGPSQSAHRMIVEDTVNAAQFNLDGYVWQGQAAMVGVVDAVMYPGTQAFMRWDFPSVLPTQVQQRALDVAQKFLSAIGFDHGMFNMEFFHDPVTGKLTVIEFNPRMASQFSDLYRRVCGIDLHACSLAMARGLHPDSVAKTPVTAGVASSLVYRSFRPGEPCPMPNTTQTACFAREFPDGMLFPFPKDAGSIARDFKWLGSYRYGIVHLGGKDVADLKGRTDRASALLGWPSPYMDHSRSAMPGTNSSHSAPTASAMPIHSLKPSQP
jgi:hypothetical protein